MDGNTSSSFDLPGFRFHPTEEELLDFYLKNMVYGRKMYVDIIGLLNIYRYDPWDLPGLSKVGEREWYFFVPRDRKHSNGGRPNRTTEHGFWKATGSDRKIVSLSEPKRVIGLRKTLVFYKGRAPRGCKTDWIMNEYRLPDNLALPKDIVLCKIYRKATSLKELEQRVAMEEATEKSKNAAAAYPTSPILSSSYETESFLGGCQIQDSFSQITSDYNIITTNTTTNTNTNTNTNTMTLKKEDNFANIFVENNCKVAAASSSNPIQLPFGKETIQLQLPKTGMDWAQDPLSSSLCSPWFENFFNFSSPTLISQIL